MNGFSNQGFSNQSGPRFAAVLSKTYANYSENVENDDDQSQFSRQLTPVLREESVKSYHQLPDPNLCENCAAYSEHVGYLCEENELLHQLVDNFRKRAKDPQSHGNQMIRKYDSSGNGGKDSKQLFANEVAVKLSIDQILQQYTAAHEEDKIAINRLKSEMDFFKALNQNTDSSWRKKLEDLTTDKETVIKELQNFIAENAETISRLTTELETVKHSKQDSINSLTSEIFSVKSSNQKTIAALTTELETVKHSKQDSIKTLTSELSSVKSSSQKTIAALTSELEKMKCEKKDAQEKVYKLVHELASAESKAVENQMKVKDLNKELTRVQRENQETINRLEERYNSEDNVNDGQTNLDKLTKDLAATKAQYHLQMNKIAKDIEAIKVSKAESSCSWRK